MALGKSNMARPTKYSEEILDKAVGYVTLFFDEKTRPKDEVIPSIEGLSIHLEITRPTVYDWASQDSKGEFSYIVERLLAKQGLILLNGTLTNQLNSNVGKAILSKHGYTERTETDITTKGQPIFNAEQQLNKIYGKDGANSS